MNNKFTYLILLVVTTVLLSFPANAAEAQANKVHTREATDGPVISLDGGEWFVATDPGNVGRGQSWWTGPVAGAKAFSVPGFIQMHFPAYHGVGWYWRDFVCPPHPDPNGRYLLRFWSVGYLAEVWVNGTHVGGHEGADTPFTLDVTETVKAGAW